MRNNLLEQTILYVLVACAALAIATLARVSAVSLGFDSFTAFMVFIVVLAIQVVAYLSIHVFLQNLILPWIGKGLSRIPFLRNKIKCAVRTDIIYASATEKSSLEDIRNAQLQNRAKEKEKKQNIALDYACKVFAPYASDEQIKILCENLQLYVHKLDMKGLHPVKISKELSTLDIYHFGWNIWNYFKIGKQIDIAYFLKKVFSDILKDVEVETIKRHLKDDELKGDIKIQERLF